jgi:hypothetical protein
MKHHRTSFIDWSPQGWIEDAERLDALAGRFRGHPFLGASFAALARDARWMSRERIECRQPRPNGLEADNLQPSTALA